MTHVAPRFDRTFQALTAATSELRYDDEGQVYPHIYGPLNTDALIGTMAVGRDDAGRFTGIRSA